MLFRRSRLSELEPARRALAEGQYEVAFALLESAARRPLGRTTQAIYLLHLAAFYALYGVDGVENGLLVLREAVGADPNLSQQPLYQALYWEFAAYRGDPVAEIKRGVRRIHERGDPLAGYHAASALLSVGAARSAARMLEELEGPLPQYLVWRRWSLLGQAHEALGNFEAAAEAFEAAVAACAGPEQEPERLSLASAWLELGEADSASEALQQTAEELLTQDELAFKRYLEGRAQLELGNPNRALERYTEALSLEGEPPSFNLLFALGQCLMQLGRVDDGAEMLARAVAEAPSDHRPVAQHELALALIEGERLDEADRVLAEVVGDPGYPQRPEAFADLADVRFRNGDLQEAQQLAEQALEMGAVAPACLTLGSVAYEYYHLEEAAGYFEQVVAASQPGDPLWVSAHQLLADIFSQRGAAEAERLYTHAKAALAFTDAASDWYLPLNRYLEQAREALGGHERVLN